ncbi:glucose-6-phosphate dehydrogenase [Desulfogranum japonicum]|uniref:glucose-6-phosphate dehydrogenase n=1 Tax=Desulfogranum japonicum TaxID=231447 RepID=UPI0003F9D846|nr:glucose-6-phosphate dehydrogenase [Desulfogranum japonicum]
MTTHACDLLHVPALDPCTIVIFGGSGDLTSRKLIPSLFSLFCEERLSPPFRIVGVSRTQLDDQRYRAHLTQKAPEEVTQNAQWEKFLNQIHYHAVEYEPKHFSLLKTFLDELSLNQKTGNNTIFYLAVPPQLYPTIAQLLGTAGLADEEQGWSRIVVEKPFGHDLESALNLDMKLHEHFREKQIFRIDHYLAKETIQNLLIFRFANTIFEPVWNRRYIDSVHILAAEQLGVETRAGYYEKSGVVRDMFQNHLMQLMVLTAMEPPARLSAEHVQDEKVKVIRSLRDFNPSGGSKITLGQYTAGTINGKAVQGYREERDIAPNSQTPTYARLETYIDNWRWQGVPFYLISGKRMAEKKTQIAIQFKDVPHRIFQGGIGDTIQANRLIIETFPQEAIRLSFQTKNPGPQLCLRTMDMDFLYQEHYPKPVPDAYARVLYDCIAGDHMLFWRQDGVEASWRYLTPVLEACEYCEQSSKLHFYPAGSWGPDV